uniref:Uncharacterized protein n=1 Tax=Oncorhynchus tshawytscha TaxID=74940 RepID=A0A8C8CCM0_ONCTS
MLHGKDQQTWLHHPASVHQDGITVEGLIRRSLEAKEFAYCPYIRFRVGAALLQGRVRVSNPMFQGSYRFCNF